MKTTLTSLPMSLEVLWRALSYMLPIGRVSKALNLAKGAVAKTAARELAY